MFDWLLGRKQYHYFVGFHVYDGPREGAGNIHLISNFAVVDWDSFVKTSEYLKEQYPGAVITTWPHLMKVDRVR